MIIINTNSYKISVQQIMKQEMYTQNKIQNLEILYYSLKNVSMVTILSQNFLQY